MKYVVLIRHGESEYGGFGSAPKFPSFQHIIYLLNYYKKVYLKGCTGNGRIFAPYDVYGRHV